MSYWIVERRRRKGDQWLRMGYAANGQTAIAFRPGDDLRLADRESAEAFVRGCKRDFDDSEPYRATEIDE